MSNPSLSRPVLNELHKSPGVDTHGARIRIRFLYRGIRCAETLKGVKPTVEGIRFARRKRETILYEIDTGAFDYAKHFPDSRRLALFSPTKAKSRTVAQGIDLWLASQKVKKARSTYRGYANKAGRVKKRFGDEQISAVGKAEIEAYQAELIEQDGLNPKTVNDIFTVIRGVWRDAFIDGYIARDFMGRVTNFDVSDRNSDAFPFTQDQLSRIAGTPTDSLSEVHMVMFNCWVGLSASELIALAWEDIDMQRWTARVRRARVDTQYKVPKEKVRTRTVELLHPARVWLLKQWALTNALQPQTIEVKQRDNVTWRTETIRPVFVSTRTQRAWTTDHNFSARFFRTHLRRAKVPYRALNQTRHTFASQMLTNYVSKDWIINQLGHKDYTMLYKHYAKFIPDDTPLLANLISQQLGLDTAKFEAEMVQLGSSLTLKIVK